MNGIAVESTALAALAYDEVREILQLEFRSRTVYRYFGVTRPMYEALVCAASKGKFFNEAIRGRFPYVLVAEARAGEA